ncbi:MAG: 7-cyano-7-deazaguanine synthase QueC [Marinicaulis sp.]|nr:7-cyano-7-deazaguanine synthase QueC [Marinicaulis sp.]NNL88545.1 7-cyano-7-deazaguanine synthase QueC [Marinicaulis sp.]
MRKLSKNKAVVLFSGGQDSSIALAWALDRFEHIETIGFDYSQRHAIELGARKKVRSVLKENFAEWDARLGDDLVVSAGGLHDLGATAMTDHIAIEVAEDGLPNTFVPGRNLLFLVLAAGMAYRRDLGVIVAGMCEADYSGYPDCREGALAAQMKALQLGVDANVSLETPLMHIDKAESWRLAEKLGGEKLVTLINEHSHSCYQGVRATRYDWGYGCGECPACELRAKGWAGYKAA